MDNNQYIYYTDLMYGPVGTVAGAADIAATGGLGQRAAHKHKDTEGKTKTHSHNKGNKSHTHPKMPVYIGVATKGERVRRGIAHQLVPGLGGIRAGVGTRQGRASNTKYKK